MSTSQQNSTPVHITEFDNLWNQIALEFSSPTLHPSRPPLNLEKVKGLARRIKELDPGRYPYVLNNFGQCIET